MTRTTISQQLSAANEQVETLRERLANAQASLNEQGVRVEQAHVELMTLRAEVRLFESTKQELAEVKKDRDSKKSMYEMYQRTSQEKENEIEQAHAVLDGVEEAPGREYEATSGGYTNNKQRNVVTRLAGAFLSIAKGAGVK